MRKIEVFIRQIIWALQKTGKITNYDKVIYRGRIYYVKSSFCGEDFWDLFHVENNIKDPIHPSPIRGDMMYLIRSLKRDMQVFKKYLSFQKQNWGHIDRNKKLGDRLSYLSSDNIKF